MFISEKIFSHPYSQKVAYLDIQLKVDFNFSHTILRILYYYCLLSSVASAFKLAVCLMQFLSNQNLLLLYGFFFPKISLFSCSAHSVQGSISFNLSWYFSGSEILFFLSAAEKFSYFSFQLLLLHPVGLYSISNSLIILPAMCLLCLLALISYLSPLVQSEFHSEFLYVFDIF